MCCLPIETTVIIRQTHIQNPNIHRKGDISVKWKHHPLGKVQEKNFQKRKVFFPIKFKKSVLSNKIGHHHHDWQQSCSSRTDLRSDRPSLVGGRQLHRPCIHLSHTSSVHTPIWTIFDAVQSFRAFAQRTVFIDNIALTGWGTNQIRSAAVHSGQLRPFLHS